MWHIGHAYRQEGWKLLHLSTFSPAIVPNMADHEFAWKDWCDSSACWVLDCHALLLSDFKANMRYISYLHDESKIGTSCLHISIPNILSNKDLWSCRTGKDMYSSSVPEIWAQQIPTGNLNLEGARGHTSAKIEEAVSKHASLTRNWVNHAGVYFRRDVAVLARDFASIMGDQPNEREEVVCAVRVLLHLLVHPFCNFGR